MALQGAGRWDVTVAAPTRLRGDLREIELESIPGEACAIVPLDVRFGAHPHLRFYGRALRPRKGSGAASDKTAEGRVRHQTGAADRR